MRCDRVLVGLCFWGVLGCGSGGVSSGPGGTNPGSGGSTGSNTGGQGAGGSRAGSGGAGPGSGGTSVGSGGRGVGSGGAGAGSGGTSVGSGGMGVGSGGANAGSGGSAIGGISGGSLLDRITTSDVITPAGVKAGVRNYRIWGAVMLRVAPVYTAPLANCGTLVCYTTGTAAAPNARVARLDGSDRLLGSLDLGAGVECRGIAAEPDGHFAALLWADTTDQIYVKRFDLAGTMSFSTELTNVDNHPTDFGIGESRLEFGAGKYGAYYHVHSDSGHEGDTLKFVAAATGAQTTQWSWGCSHSMSDLLSFSPAANTFLPVCVTDCYPGTGSGDFAAVSKGGIYTDNRNKVIDVAAGCNGSVAGELGGAAVASAGWKIVFNAHQSAVTLGQSSYSTSSMNQDIGFSSIATNHTAAGAVVWLTTTPSVNEADSAMARWQPEGDAAEQYVVGWMEPTPTPVAYKLSRVNAAGAVLEAPVNVVAKARWGQRDDPFRVHTNRDVVWAWFDAAGATTLHFARLHSGGTATCASF